MALLRWLGSFALIADVLAVVLVLFDVFGAGLWFIISLFDGRRLSPAASYAVWLVAGVFAGFAHYHGSMVISQAESGRIEVSPPFGRAGNIGLTAALLFGFAATIRWTGHSDRLRTDNSSCRPPCTGQPAAMTAWHTASKHLTRRSDREIAFPVGASYGKK